MAHDNDIKKVLIVGAGMSGLMLGILLTHAGIDNFHIYERSAVVKPIGSTMAFDSRILAVLEQLGMLEDALKISLPCRGMNIYDNNLQVMGGFDLSDYKNRTGYDMILFSRPQMHQLFLSKIPKEKLHLGKKIESIEDNGEEVTIHCADGSSASGDILVGADGAYSSVRTNLFKAMAEKDVLPEADKEDLSVGHICMVGTTKPLEDNTYKALKDNFSHFERVIMQGTPHSWSTATVPGNRVCWLMTTQLESTSTDITRFKNAEWGSKANQSMIEEVRDYPCALGGTMGDLIDLTPPEMISRAINALQDAVILANCIYDITSATPENIHEAFADYRSQRYPKAKYQIDKSKVMATIQYGQTWKDRVIRHIIFNWIPKSIQTELFLKDTTYRPQVMFLPNIENRGTVVLEPQQPCKKYTLKQSEE
ncbi:hypothetical protein BGZ93_005582 [Podila epicladia]|nr:hypothetical protein BGZ92_001255 [Podila epicladia]KAG0095668.1 hypothetical protein BGZ93_005582 [Podila epicladia]